MTPLEYNGIECTACGCEFDTLGDYEAHGCPIVVGVSGP